MGTSSSSSEEEDGYCVVVSPVPVQIELVGSEEEAIEVIKHHASIMQVPEHHIVDSGLFNVFKGNKACLRTSSREISLDS